ncbi:MAG TPA: sucrase ferredoxin [Pyrinomonadaceae bacterium]|jgi:hypothetical protein|nr:sucrase ferredoxin [Pyrinomonadaceae bacterium]
MNAGGEFYYCSEFSRRLGEKAFGTASLGAVWFLLEYSLTWKSKAFEQSALSDEIKTFFNSALKRIPNSRVLFVKRDRPCSTDINFFVVRTRERRPFVLRYGLSSYADVLGVDLDEAICGRPGEGGEMHRGPLFLVCTHGRRDKCCAKFGVPLYRALRESAGDAVWQSSHVGGDRFAANLVCFPHGLFYAHAGAESGARIVEAYREGRLSLADEFRGRSCYAYPIQAAEFFVRRETGVDAVEGLRYLSSERAGEKTWRVRFAGPGGAGVHEALVTTRPSDERRPITCHSPEERSVPEFILDEYRFVAAATPSAP